MIYQLVHLAFRLLNPSVHTAVLGVEHIDAAASLLADEFGKREPLCRLLDIPAAELLPFFQQQVAHVAARGLGVVAVDRNGMVRGAMTSEDHLDLFAPNDLALTKGLEVIGSYLEQTAVPPELVPKRPGIMYYGGLAAVDRQYKKSTLLSLMILANYGHLRRLGYIRGYAKVTNPRVVEHLLRLERLSGKKKIFTATSTTKPADFVFNGERPFSAYQGKTWLMTWIFP